MYLNIVLGLSFLCWAFITFIWSSDSILNVLFKLGFFLLCIGNLIAFLSVLHVINI